MRQKYKRIWRKLFNIPPILFAIFLLVSGKSQRGHYNIWRNIFSNNHLCLFSFSRNFCLNMFQGFSCSKEEKKRENSIPPSHKHWVVAIKAGDHHVLQPGPGFIIFQWPSRTFALIWLIFSAELSLIMLTLLKKIQRAQEDAFSASPGVWGSGGWGRVEMVVGA